MPAPSQVDTLLVAETERPIVNLSHGQQSVVGQDLTSAVIPGVLKARRGSHTRRRGSGAGGAGAGRGAGRTSRGVRGAQSASSLEDSADV